jgi:hypothetical protein
VLEGGRTVDADARRRQDRERFVQHRPHRDPDAASFASNFVTGQTYVVDGGAFMQ